MNKKVSVRILILTTIAMMFSFTVWASLSPLAAEFEEIYGLSATEKSILVAVPVILGSVMRVPLGILADRFGGRKVFTLLLLFTVVPLIGVSFSTSYLMLLFWAFFLGMSGASFAVSITFVSQWTPKEKQGTALGINGIGNIGNALAGFSLPAIVAMVGIQATFLGLIFPILLMAVLLWFWTPETPRTGEKKTVTGSLSVLKFKHSWILSLFYFVTFGAFVAFTMYLPTLLMDLYNVSPVDAGARSAGFVVLATLVRPIGGYLGDKWGAGRVLTWVFLGIIAGSLGISASLSSLWLLTFPCLLVALMTGVGNGAVFRLVPELFPASTGAVTGIVGASGGLGGFFPPILLGTIKDATGSYMLGFILLSLLSIVCLVINMIYYHIRQTSTEHSSQ